MTRREQYSPGPADIAQVRKDGEQWTLVLVKALRHSRETVWQALTEPGQLRAVGRFFQTVARILRDGQQRGELRRDLDPDVAGYVFVGGLEIVITALVLGVNRESDADPDAYSSKVARTVVEIFLRGIGGRA